MNRIKLWLRVCRFCFLDQYRATQIISAGAKRLIQSIQQKIGEASLYCARRQ